MTGGGREKLVAERADRKPAPRSHSGRWKGGARQESEREGGHSEVNRHGRTARNTRPAERQPHKARTSEVGHIIGTQADVNTMADCGTRSRAMNGQCQPRTSISWNCLYL